MAGYIQCIENSFHHHRNTPNFPTVHMNGSPLKEASCFDRLLGLKFTPDLRWNTYIRSVAKATGKMVGSFYRSKKYHRLSLLGLVSPHPLWQIIHTFSASLTFGVSSMRIVSSREHLRYGTKCLGTAFPAVTT